jgi:putative ABC transport system permease protein
MSPSGPGWPGRSWLGAIRTATGGVTRHKVQTVVIGLVLLIATASATLGLTLLAASHVPYQRAFTAQRGADLAVTVNPARATSAELAATGGLPGVTAAAGPFAEATVQVDHDGQPWRQLILAGRASAGGRVDDLVLSAGHWPDRPGQVVLEGSGPAGPTAPRLGSTLTVTGLPGTPALAVVGFANSITDSADGWVSPGEIARLRAPREPASAQLLYRFARAATVAQVRADAAEVSQALPPGATAGGASWLAAQSEATSQAAVMEPFVVAFALIGLAVAVLITGNVISGAVVAGYHRIGVLKSIGLTPAQVVAAYLTRVGWPALAGCLAGVVAGNLLAVPLLKTSSAAYNVGGQQVPWWASAAAPVGLLVLTMLAALGPALRAGRLSAVQAIAAGRAPRAARGYAAHRLAARLRLPRPAGLGLAAPFARPARTMVTLAAIAFGATAVIFAVGLNSALGRAEASQNLINTVPVRVEPIGPGSGGWPAQVPSAAQDAAVTAALGGQPGTLHDVPTYSTQVRVPGVTGDVYAQVFGGGDALWLGYALISGRWYGAPGEVVVNSTFLTDSGLAVGDTATVAAGRSPVVVRIVGQVFEPSRQPFLFGSARTLSAVVTGQNLQGWYVAPRPGTSLTAYIQAVNASLGSHSPWAATVSTESGGKFYKAATALIGLLALMVAVAAGLGVLNTVLMTTRDRVHDLGIFKALGMRPGQLLTMVVCWIIGPAVVAAVVAAPVAVVLTTITVHAMGGAIHTGIPASFTQVLPPPRLALLSLAALVIAAAGALLPASWAARARPAVALRAE